MDVKKMKKQWEILDRKLARFNRRYKKLSKQTDSILGNIIKTSEKQDKLVQKIISAGR